MPDYASLPLGKQAARHDPRTLLLHKYLDLSALPAVPATRAWDKGITSFGYMKNDSVGCCTCSAIGHQIQIWTANSASEVTIADNDIITAYSAISGYNPQTGQNDNGAVELDALRYWRATGVGGHKLGAWADVAPTNHPMVEAAIDLFGGIYIGVGLPITAQTQMGTMWDVVGDGKTGNSTPFSWGGHAINIIDYDANGVTCVTWGELQRISWRFIDVYCDEMHVPIAADWFSGKLLAPSGFDIDALTRDLALVSGQPDPGPAPTPTPPPWQPDSVAVAWLTWLQSDLTWITNQYLSANVAGAAPELATLSGGALYLQTYLAGQAAAKAPPALPGA